MNSSNPWPSDTASRPIKESIAIMQERAERRWGTSPGKLWKDCRNVIRVLKKVEGKYVQISFGRVVNGRKVEIRVRGGCRL